MTELYPTPLAKIDPLGMLFAWFRSNRRDGAAINRINYWFGEIRKRK